MSLARASTSSDVEDISTSGHTEQQADTLQQPGRTAHTEERMWLDDARSSLLWSLLAADAALQQGRRHRRKCGGYERLAELRTSSDWGTGTGTGATSAG